MDDNTLELLPVKVRRGLYIGYGIAIIIMGGIDAWYGDTDPAWTAPIRRVLVYLGIPFAGLAAVNARRAARNQSEYKPERAMPEDQH